MAICCRCATTNVHLRAWIANHGRLQKCDCCGTVERSAVDAGQFVQHIDSVIQRYYTPDDHGERPTTLISQVAGVTSNIASQVVMIGRERDELRPGFYDHDLSLAGRWLHRHSKLWGHFKQSIKYDARFLGAHSRSILDELFAGISTFCRGIAVRTLTSVDRVFRARPARSLQEARDWFQHPEKHLQAPPQERVRAGRMNAAGIRVLYGALGEQTAVAEIRPQVGSHVVVGSFAPSRPLRVLDIGALNHVRDCADLFDPEFDFVSKRLVFLRMLEQEISLPVQFHGDEALDYIPTQVVAEYIRTALKFDGVIYGSAQLGRVPEPGQFFGSLQDSGERNVVLFGAAAITSAEPSPEAVEPGLRFVSRSEQLIDVTKVEIVYRQNMGAHYEAPPRKLED